MKKDVIMTIRTSQTQSDDTEHFELVTRGRLTSHGSGGYLLSYQESPITGMENTRCTFRVEQGRVSLVRTGQICWQMMFELGRKHTTVYNTPFGAFEVGVTTRMIDADLNDNGGHLYVDYSIELEHQSAGLHQFRIEVREAGLPVTKSPARTATTPPHSRSLRTEEGLCARKAKTKPTTDKLGV